MLKLSSPTLNPKYCAIHGFEQLQAHQAELRSPQGPSFSRREQAP